MSTTPEDAPKPRPVISIPFLIFAAVLLVGGIFGGPLLMKAYFYREEVSKKNAEKLTHLGKAGMDKPRDAPTTI